MLLTALLSYSFQFYDVRVWWCLVLFPRLPWMLNGKRTGKKPTSKLTWTNFKRRPKKDLMLRSLNWWAMSKRLENKHTIIYTGRFSFNNQGVQWPFYWTFASLVESYCFIIIDWSSHLKSSLVYTHIGTGSLFTSFNAVREEGSLLPACGCMFSFWSMYVCTFDLNVEVWVQ